MTATVFLTQYASFGGRNPGGEDDVGGSFPQCPGEIISFTEINATGPGAAITFDPRTSFIEFQSFDGDVWFNYNTGGVGTLLANARGRCAEGVMRFQGTKHSKTGVQRYTQINLIDVS